MDLNKEIKLSDLVRRPKKKKKPGVVKPSNAQAQAASQAGDRRPQDRRLPDRGLAGRQQRLREARAARAGSARARRRRRRRGARRCGARDGARPLLHRQQASAPGHPARHRHQPHRRAHGRHRRRRRRAPARQRRSLQGARGPLDPARPGRPRLPRRQRDGGRVRGRLTARPARGRLQGADRPLRRGVPGGGPRALGHRRRGVRAAARRRAALRPTRKSHRRSPRSSSRSVTTARRWRSPTAPSATSCAFSTGEGRSSRPRSRGSSGSPCAEAAELKLELDLGGDAPDGDDPRAPFARAAVERELQTLARELVASLHFYQGQPGSLAISEVIVTGGTTRLPGLAEELERLTRVPVRIADPLAGVQVSNGLAERDDLASLAAAIGLGVEG